MTERITAHLRGSMGDVSEKMDAIDAVVAGLEAENAKLRKLVRDAIYARDDADWASIVSTAIGLGVEVD